MAFMHTAGLLGLYDYIDIVRIPCLYLYNGKDDCANTILNPIITLCGYVLRNLLQQNNGHIIVTLCVLIGKISMEK